MYILVFLAIGTLVSEDLTCIGAGALVATGEVGFLAASVACFVGILAGDLMLYLAGWLAGSRLPRRFVAHAHVSDRQGLAVILLSRFTPGTRLPLYVAAGVVGASWWRFVLYSAIACALWTPALVGGTVWLGRSAAERALASASSVGLSLAGIVILCRTLTWERRRRIVGFLLRKVRWEFWSVWAAYAPLVPWFVWLGLRHRSLTVFTAANPGIYSGGLVGESKAAILRGLAASGAVAEWALARDTEQAIQFIDRSNLSWPVVLKPDVGERGAGVAIVRSHQELEDYFSQSEQKVIVQEYVPGVEFGVFYCRRSGEERGRILSITEKRLPAVNGDGETTLKRLILRDSRAVCAASAYLTRHCDAATRVPLAGETVPLVEVGSHCRGAIFLDGMQHWTPALEQRVDEISKTHEGFYFGRYDIRAASVAEFRAARFRVIELNGVAAEPAHIYDPAVSLWDAYKALARHWKLAFEIGAANRKLGAAPLSARELLRLGYEHRQLVPVQEEHRG
jgi:membrane protein DedA with SNARE-associated domain